MMKLEIIFFKITFLFSVFVCHRCYLHNEFMDSYVKLNATWTAQDYGKPGLPSDVEGKFWETNLSQFYVNADDECSFAMKLNFEKL